jgi:cytosine/adenosine deaminase-related metal-dependent hydrolase
MGKALEHIEAGSTVIAAPWVVAFDGTEHRLLRDGRVVFRGDEIIHVGESWTGPGRVIEAAGKLVIPGFVSPHVHFSSAAEGEAGLTALLRHGVTTVAATTAASEVAALAAAGRRLGLRLLAGPLLGAGDDLPSASQELLALDESWSHDLPLLRRAAEAARQADLPLSLPVGNSLWDFHDTLRRIGLTEAGLLEREGVLKPGLILRGGHFLGGHRATAHPSEADRALLAGSGAVLVHAPTQAARQGLALESLERYRRGGIRLALSAGAPAYDMIQEMQVASLMAKVVDGDHLAGSARAVFDAATLGGAQALRRPDLGRLAPGARADIVLIELDSLRAGPVRDPLRTLVHALSGACVDTVIVGGRTLVNAASIVPHGSPPHVLHH